MTAWVTQVCLYPAMPHRGHVQRHQICDVDCGKWQWELEIATGWEDQLTIQSRQDLVPHLVKERTEWAGRVHMPRAAEMEA